MPQGVEEVSFVVTVLNLDTVVQRVAEPFVQRAMRACASSYYGWDRLVQAKDPSSLRGAPRYVPPRTPAKEARYPSLY